MNQSSVENTTTTKRYLLQALVLLTVTALLFLPVIHFGFVWDDDLNIRKNYLINPPDPSNVFMFWLEPFLNLYAPVTYSFFLWLANLSTSLFGEISPLPFHVASLVLHCLNSLLVFKLLTRIAKNNYTALIGALVFALHPLQMESVAWVIEQRTLLATFFGLLSIESYLARLNPDSSKLRAAVLYRFSLLFFVLAVLSKPSAVVIPVFILLLHRTLKKSDWITIIKAISPWFAVALILSFVTIHLQNLDAMNSSFARDYIQQIPPLWSRFRIWGDANFFYLYKALLPTHLSPLYGRTPSIVLSEWSSYIKLLLMASLVITTWLQRHRYPLFALGMAIFLIGILPVSGIIPFVFQVWSTVADRYTYLSMFGISIIVVAIVDGHYRKFTLPLTVLMIITWSVYGRLYHLNDYRDDLSLWGRAVETCGAECPRAYYNLAAAYSWVHDNPHALSYFAQWLGMYRYGTSPDNRACMVRSTLTAQYECILDNINWYEKTERNNVQTMHIYVLLKLGRFDKAEEYFLSSYPWKRKEEELDYFCKIYGNEFPRYFVKRAEWLLSSERNKEAEADLERIRKDHYAFDPALYPHVAQALDDHSSRAERTPRSVDIAE